MWSIVSGTTGSWLSLPPLVLLSLLKGSGWASSLVGRLSVSDKFELDLSAFWQASFSPILLSQQHNMLIS
jgi:hypothetical protein